MPGRMGLRSWHNQGCDHNIVKEKKVMSEVEIIKKFWKKESETNHYYSFLKNNEEFVRVGRKRYQLLKWLNSSSRLYCCDSLL